MSKCYALKILIVILCLCVDTNICQLISVSFWLLQSSKMSSTCPFAKGASVGAVCPMRSQENQEKPQAVHEDKRDDKSHNSDTISPKCPYGFDSQNFKLGPLSCMICQSLLFESSKCMPCSHKFCKWVMDIAFNFIFFFMGEYMIEFLHWYSGFAYPALVIARSVALI